MICYNCGNDVTTQGANCPFCGSPLSAGAGNQRAYNPSQVSDNNSVSPQTASIICYITWIGLLLSLLMCDTKEPFFRFHLNNSIVIAICSFALGVIAIIPILGWIVGLAGEIFLFVCLIMGLVNAINGECKDLPVIGQFKLLK